jgi:hypothetical protein
MLFFIAINLWAIAGAANWFSGHGIGSGIIDEGFPLKWFNVVGYGPVIVWDALATNISIALTASLIAGIVIKPVFHPDR